mgnify:CR=1 FL=1
MGLALEDAGQQPHPDEARESREEDVAHARGLATTQQPGAHSSGAGPRVPSDGRSALPRTRSSDELADHAHEARVRADGRRANQVEPQLDRARAASRSRS